MPEPGGRLLREYTFTVVVSLAAAGLRWAAEPILGDQLPYVTFFIPVVAASWYGGWRCGLLAVALSVGTALAFFAPAADSPSGMKGVRWFGAGMFLLSSLILVAICDTLRRAQVALRRTEQEAGQQREWLRVTLASIGDAMIATDSSGRVTLMNDVAQSLTGWTQAEAEGLQLERLFAIVDEQTGEPLVHPVTRVLEQGEVVGITNHALLVARDGTRRAIDDSAAPIRDAAGTLIGAVLVFRDVTEKRLSEAALLASEARHAATVETSLDCIISMDDTGRIIEFNAAAERTFGLKRSEAIAREMAEMIIPASQRAQHREGLARYLATGEGPILGRRLEMTALRADGGEFPVEMAIIRLPGEGPPVFVGFLRDITERKLAETAKLDADRRKDEFLATLAHELRNPLAPLRNGLQIIAMAKDDPQAVERAHSVMERQLGQLIRLVDDLLDLSRISRGKLDLKLERVDLIGLLRSVIEAGRLLPECVQQDIAASLPEGPVYLIADPTRLAQMFANLFSNACKFTGKDGHIVVTLSVEADEVRVSVRDSGIGISAEMLPRIFEMFTQADQRPEKPQRGLGIGLTLVRRLAAMHGGSVEATSAGLGHGSEFLVRLPLPALPVSSTAALPRRTLPALRRRILVVDDNRDAATSLAMMLRLLGSDVQEAYDAPRGIELASALRPDTIILDIGMPGMNGYDAARRIRAQEWGRSVMLIALTGWGQDDDISRSREAGFDHHLVKPVDHAALVELLSSTDGRTG